MTQSTQYWAIALLSTPAAVALVYFSKMPIEASFLCVAFLQCSLIWSGYVLGRKLSGLKP
jgi:hypothetical protein